MKILIVLSNLLSNDELLTFGGMFAQQTEIPLTVLAVVGSDKESHLADAKKNLAEAQAKLNLPNLVTKFRIGDLCEQVKHEVEQENFELVIIGERNTSYIDRWIHRFPSAVVAENVPCSAIVFKGKAKPIRRILLCDSGAGRASVLSQFTAQLARILPGDENVTILHVMSQISAGPGVTGKNLRANTDELIEEHTREGLLVEADVQALHDLGIHSSPMVRHGLVVDEILAEARSGDYDLVIVGAHEYQPPKTFLLENIARQILRKINKPILIVRGNEDIDRK
jgi:nucleotide-binding universal stress UspA family protein